MRLWRIPGRSFAAGAGAGAKAGAGAAALPNRPAPETEWLACCESDPALADGTADSGCIDDGAGASSDARASVDPDSSADEAGVIVGAGPSVKVVVEEEQSPVRFAAKPKTNPVGSGGCGFDVVLAVVVLANGAGAPAVAEVADPAKAAAVPKKETGAGPELSLLWLLTVAGAAQNWKTAPVGQDAAAGARGGAAASSPKRMAGGGGGTGGRVSPGAGEVRAGAGPALAERGPRTPCTWSLARFRSGCITCCTSTPLEGSPPSWRIGTWRIERSRSRSQSRSRSGSRVCIGNISTFGPSLPAPSQRWRTGNRWESEPSPTQQLPSTSLLRFPLRHAVVRFRRAPGFGPNRGGKLWAPIGGRVEVCGVLAGGIGSGHESGAGGGLKR